MVVKWYKWYVGGILVLLFLFEIGNDVRIILRNAAVSAAKQTTEEEPSETLVLIIPAAEEFADDRAHTEYEEYIVNPGDTLWSLAEQYLDSGEDYPILAELNGIENADLIYAEQLLTVPIDVTETVRYKDDWFYRNEIPIQAQGTFYTTLSTNNVLSGESGVLEEVPVTVKISVLDLDYRRSGYQLVEAVFDMDAEDALSYGEVLSYYYEVADRYTGVSFIQNSTHMTDIEEKNVRIYRLAISSLELGYEGTVEIVCALKSNRLTIQAETPKEYDGLVFALGNDIEADSGKYASDKLYTVDQFGIENVRRPYFSACGY